MTEYLKLPTENNVWVAYMVDIKNKLNEPTILKNFSLIIFSILILNFLQVSIEIKTLLFVLFSLIYMRYDIELPLLK